MSIHRTEFTVFVSPLVPDAHPVVFQLLDIGVATQKPQQLVDNRLKMKFLGGEEREALFKIKPHLIAEDTDSTSARAVFFLYALRQYAIEQV